MATLPPYGDHRVGGVRAYDGRPELDPSLSPDRPPMDGSYGTTPVYQERSRFEGRTVRPMYSERETWAGGRTLRDHRSQVGTGIVAGASAIEVLGGALGGLLALIALFDVLPFTLGSMSLIILSGALLVGGVVQAMRVRDLRFHTSMDGYVGSAGVELVAGLFGIIIGGLALADIAPITMMAVGLIVLGIAFLVGGAARARDGRSTTEISTNGLSDAIHRSAGGVNLLVGLCASVIGVLVLLGVELPLTLSLVGLLLLGLAAVVEGVALASAAFSRRPERGMGRA